MTSILECARKLSQISLRAFFLTINRALKDSLQIKLIPDGDVFQKEIQNIFCTLIHGISHKGSFLEEMPIQVNDTRQNFPVLMFCFRFENLIS